MNISRPARKHPGHYVRHTTCHDWLSHPHFSQSSWQFICRQHSIQQDEQSLSQVSHVNHRPRKTTKLFAALVQERNDVWLKWSPSRLLLVPSLSRMQRQGRGVDPDLFAASDAPGTSSGAFRGGGPAIGSSYGYGAPPPASAPLRSAPGFHNPSERQQPACATIELEHVSGFTGKAKGTLHAHPTNPDGYITWYDHFCSDDQPNSRRINRRSACQHGFGRCPRQAA